MDGARAAIRVEGVEEVSVVYRRTKKEMPADLEEYHNAITDGVKFYFLTNPESYTEDGTLICRKMTLGDLDASGRRKPVATDETITFHADALITAIGEKVDSQALTWFGVPVDEKGWPAVNSDTLETMEGGVYVLGDAQSGPSTVALCIASARKAVEAAIDSVLGPQEHDHDCDCDHDHDHDCDCGHGHDEEEEYSDDEIDALEDEEHAFFAEIRAKKGLYLAPAKDTDGVEVFAQREAARCLECSYICDKCIEVCPNRANVAIDMRHRNDLYDNPFQIVHLDAFCNECGNCATFCPWEGSPYLDKLTLFSRKDDFENSENNGFLFDEGKVLIRLGEIIEPYEITSDGSLEGELPEEISAVIEEILLNHSYLLGAVED